MLMYRPSIADFTRLAGVQLNCDQRRFAFMQPAVAVLNNILFQVIPTQDDGHCFMYALHISMETYLYEYVSYREIVYNLQKETMDNEGLYMGFLPKFC